MTIAFTRFSNKGGTYFADGDDGGTWSFHVGADGTEWDVFNSTSRPKYARTMNITAWKAAGLPLTLDVGLPDVDTAPATGTDVDLSGVDIPVADPQPPAKAELSTEVSQAERIVEVEPVERIEGYLDEAQELLDESEAVADAEVAASVRDEFRTDLAATTKLLRDTHAKVAAAVKAHGGKVWQERNRGKENEP